MTGDNIKIQDSMSAISMYYSYGIEYPETVFDNHSLRDMGMITGGGGRSPRGWIRALLTGARPTEAQHTMMIYINAHVSKNRAIRTNTKTKLSDMSMYWMNG